MSPSKFVPVGTSGLRMSYSASPSSFQSITAWPVCRYSCRSAFASKGGTIGVCHACRVRQSTGQPIRRSLEPAQQDEQRRDEPPAPSMRLPRQEPDLHCQPRPLPRLLAKTSAKPALVGRVVAIDGRGSSRSAPALER